MASTSVKFDTREVELLLRRLTQGAPLKPADRTQLLANLGAEIEDQTRERFSTKQAPDGTPWADIAEATKAWYEIEFPGAQPPLVLTGGLRDSVETQSKGQWAVVVGATKEYAAVHQWGWETRGVAARPYLGVGPQGRAGAGPDHHRLRRGPAAEDGVSFVSYKSIRDSAVTQIATAFGAWRGLKVEAHPGRFDEEEVRRLFAQTRRC